MRADELDVDPGKAWGGSNGSYIPASICGERSAPE